MVSEEGFSNLFKMRGMEGIMKREIRFKAKRKKQPFDWIPWSLFDPEENWVQVNPSTVCQWTGQIDSNGREIYEGDMVQETDTLLKEIYEVYWDSLYLRFSVRKGAQDYNLPGSLWKTLKVIGNIHDKG